MISAIFLFSIFWFILCFYKLRFSLHMLQLEGYKNEKYIEWAEKNRDKIYTQKDSIYTVMCIVITLFFIFTSGRGEGNIAQYAVTASALLLLILKYKEKYNSKKPLVFTPRAKRLLMIAMGLTLIDFVIVVLIVQLITKDFVGYFPLCSGFLSIVYFFSSYYIIGANFIAQPIEKNINNKFYDAASRKIKGMKGITSVGITGSYGKTSTKFLTAAILSEKFNVINTPESYNTPMGISKVINNDLSDEHEVFIAELGATKIGDIAEVAALANPKIGILTSIGPCHLETFKSIDNIMRTKYELIEALPDDGTAIFNYDNEYVKKLADKTYKEKILYGIKNAEHADVYATDIVAGSTGSKFTLCVRDMGSIECETRLLGEHNILNILAGASTAFALGLSLDEIRKGISRIEAVEHRLQLIDPGTGVIVIDDAFNSNPDGAKAALDVLASFKDKRKIIITPGMIELGEHEQSENEKFGENIAESCDIAILVGKKQTAPIQRGLQKKGFNEDNLYVVNSLDEATKILEKLTKVNDVVLFENDLPDTYNEN